MIHIDYRSQLSVVIASRYPPFHYGGLSQYQRMLGAYLSQNDAVAGVFLAESVSPTKMAPITEESAWKTIVLGRTTGSKSTRAFCLKCAPRSFLHGLLEKVASAQWSRQIAECLPEGVKAIHFVGTGWDLFGFALLQMTRSKNLRFTILPAVHPEQWGDDALDIRLYRAADRVFALSDYEKKWLMQKGLAEEKIIVCGLPPMCATTGNSDRFRAKHGLNKRPLILFLGRKDAGKGYPALVEAWPQVRAQFPDACLVAAGPGASSTAPVGEEHEGILNVGIISEEEKADALAACDVFCLPSAHESFGIVYVEAWFYAKPVVCGTAPACRELIEDGETGLWSSQDSRELSESLCHLLSNSSLAEEMGRKGKAKQMSDFTWEKIGQLHVEEFFGDG